MRRVLHCFLGLGIMPKMGKGSSPRHAAQFSRRRFLQDLFAIAAGWPFVKIPRIGASAVSPYAFEEIPLSISGIKWVHKAGKSPEKYLPETSGSGLRIF